MGHVIELSHHEADSAVPIDQDSYRRPLSRRPVPEGLKGRWAGLRGAMSPLSWVSEVMIPLIRFGFGEKHRSQMGASAYTALTPITYTKEGGVASFRGGGRVRVCMLCMYWRSLIKFVPDHRAQS